MARLTDKNNRVLLDEIVERGWSPQRQNAFLKQFGTVLRHSILYQLRRHFGPVGLHAVGQYLESMHQGTAVTSTGGVDATYLDLAVNVWQDVLADVFKPDPNDGLIGKYRAYQDKHSDTETSGSFEGFLRQNARYKFLDNLPHKISQKEVFDKITDLEKDQDRYYYVQEARNRYGTTVKEHLGHHCDTLLDGQLSHAVDYFFEEFIPHHHAQLRNEFSAQQLRGKTLEKLLERFSAADCQTAGDHERAVYGHSGVVETRADEHIERVGAVDEISLADEVDVYWDQLIRCQQPSPEVIEKNLISTQLNQAHALCWSCAKLKTESPRKDTKENVVAFISFYCSQRGPQRGMEPLPQREALCLEQIEGRYLRWEEDVCQHIFMKNIRKDRVMDMVMQTLAASPYKHLLQQPDGKGGAS